MSLRKLLPAAACLAFAAAAAADTAAAPLASGIDESTMDPKVMPARTALTMATVGGAAAIGLSDEIGSLTVGKRADLIQVSLGDLHFTPLYDLISHLVYVADEQDVISVVVDGKVLMREHKVQTVDADQVRKSAEAIAARIRASLAERKTSAP